MTSPLSIDLPESLRSYVFLDVEASGVHARSYPIEIGWCGVDLLAKSFLIRPHDRWTEEDWSITSERIHNVPRQVLFAEGIEVVEAANRLNAICQDCEVVTDNPWFDGGWLVELFHVAGVSQQFTLQDATQLEAMAALLSGLDAGEAQALQERIKVAFPHPHRAAPDARRAAALFLCLAMPGAIDAIVAAA